MKPEDFWEIQVTITFATRGKLRAEAARRDTTVQKLLSEIITIVADDNLYDAVLDK